MKKKFRTLGTVCACALAIALPGAVNAATIYFNGFETDISSWSTPTRVASGTGGITSSAGSWHATSNIAHDFTQFGGYNFGAGGGVPTVFQEFTTSLDIYLDVGGGWANDTRFDWDAAISNNNGGFLRDFVFNAGFYDSGDATGPGAGTNRFIISASNNSSPGNAYPKDPGHAPIAISSSGWYTFEHHFYNNAGTLNVDLNILTSGGSLVNTWTLGTDAIAGVGGSRYGWLSDNDFSALAIDNASLITAAVPVPAAAWLFGSSLGLLGWARRRTAV